MSEFSERFRTSLSGFKLSDQKAQLTVASIVAVLVVLAAIVALPRGDDDPVSQATDTTTATDPGSPLVVDADGDGVPDATSGPGVITGPSGTSGTVTGSKPPPGVTVTEDGRVIKVGISYLSDPGAANAAAGFGGVGQIDQKRAWDAVIADYNRSPVNGYKLEPLYFAVTTDDVTSKGSDRLQQEACAKFTKDNKVALVWDGVVGGETLHSCLTRAKVPNLGGGGGQSFSKTYTDFPYLVSPAEAALDRMASFQVDTLVEQDFFKTFKNNALPYSPQKPADNKPRIGLIRYDQPSYKAGAATMKKALASHGLSLCSGCEFEVSYSDDNVQEQLDDATEVNAAIQNCKSRPDGPCTHMLFLGSTSGVRITLFFIDGAEKQQYRPKLGFNPLDAPTGVRDFLGASSYPQFRESSIVSWDPGQFGTKTEAFSECRALVEKAGESFSGEEGSNKELQVSGYCDSVAYTKAVLTAAGPSFSLAAWMNGVATMSPIPSASTYRMKTNATRHDGVSAIRVGKWADNCNCFKPTTGVLPV